MEVDDKVFPSFLPNNLSGDGRGRFAFAHGQRVQCLRKRDKKQGRNDFTLAMKYVWFLQRFCMNYFTWKISWEVSIFLTFAFYFCYLVFFDEELMVARSPAPFSGVT